MLKNPLIMIQVVTKTEKNIKYHNSKATSSRLTQRTLALEKWSREK